MEKYTEYRAMMLLGGVWKPMRRWNTPVPLSPYRDRESCERAVKTLKENWETEAPIHGYKPPTAWKIMHREVTVTEWEEE